jgi:hypothetical protein
MVYGILAMWSTTLSAAGRIPRSAIPEGEPVSNEELDKFADRVVERLGARQQQARYLTLGEAGKYCGGRTAEAMRTMARRGRFQIIKMRNRTYVDRFDLDRAMQEMKVEIPA